MHGSVPAAVAEVDATEKRDLLVDDDRLLVVRPQCDAVWVSHDLQTITTAVQVLFKSNMKNLGDIQG